MPFVQTRPSSQVSPISRGLRINHFFDKAFIKALISNYFITVKSLRIINLHYQLEIRPEEDAIKA
jgi:hypothetical protein